MRLIITVQTTTAKDNKKHSAFRLTAERCDRQLCALIIWTYKDLMARKCLPSVNTQVFTWKSVCQVGLRSSMSRRKNKAWRTSQQAYSNRSVTAISLAFKSQQGRAEVKTSSPVGTGRRGTFKLRDKEASTRKWAIPMLKSSVAFKDQWRSFLRYRERQPCCFLFLFFPFQWDFIFGKQSMDRL